MRRARRRDAAPQRRARGAAEARCGAVQSRDVIARRRAARGGVHGEPVDLTEQEFDLLYLLAARPGIVFSRAALLARVWSDDIYVTERTVDTVVSRAAKKVERDRRTRS